MKDSIRRNLSIFGLVLFVVSLFLTACQPDTRDAHTPITYKEERETALHGEEAPDDFIPTPGGGSYRANVHEYGIENPWTPIESTSTVLGSDVNIVNISYREYIETAVGETRNNIIIITKTGSPLFDSNLALYSVDVSAGIELTYNRGAGPIGGLGAILMIKISPDVVLGQYQLEIGFEINSEDYGTILFTIEVVKK